MSAFLFENDKTLRMTASGLDGWKREKTAQLELGRSVSVCSSIAGMMMHHRVLGDIQLYGSVGPGGHVSATSCAKGLLKRSTRI